MLEPKCGEKTIIKRWEHDALIFNSPGKKKWFLFLFCYKVGETTGVEAEQLAKQLSAIMWKIESAFTVLEHLTNVIWQDVINFNWLFLESVIREERFCNEK